MRFSYLAYAHKRRMWNSGKQNHQMPLMASWQVGRFCASFQLPAMPSGAFLIDAMLSLEQAAYLAGYIDADGCFSIGLRKQKNGRSPHHQALLSVGSTSRSMLQSFKNWTGAGSINGGSRTGLRWKNTYYWMVYGKQLDAVLEDVYPYLILKQDRADIVIALRALKRHHPRRLSEDEIRQRNVLKERLHVLNRKGYV